MEQESIFGTLLENRNKIVDILRRSGFVDIGGVDLELCKDSDLEKLFLNTFETHWDYFISRNSSDIDVEDIGVKKYIYFAYSNNNAMCKILFGTYPHFKISTFNKETGQKWKLMGYISGNRIKYNRILKMFDEYKIGDVFLTKDKLRKFVKESNKFLPELDIEPIFNDMVNTTKGLWELYANNDLKGVRVKTMNGEIGSINKIDIELVNLALFAPDRNLKRPYYVDMETVTVIDYY